jgi:hypothetical protein
MVTCKETRAVIIALHKKGFTGKDVAAGKIAPKSISQPSRNSLVMNNAFSCMIEHLAIRQK